MKRIADFIRLKVKLMDNTRNDEAFSDPILQKLMDDENQNYSYDYRWFYIPSLREDIENIEGPNNEGIVKIYIYGNLIITIDITDDCTFEELLENISK